MNGQQREPWETVPAATIATLGPLVAAGAGYAADVPGWAPALLTGAAGAAMFARDWVCRRPWSEMAFRLSAGVAAGAWTTWSIITGPWHLPNLIVGGTAALFGLFTAPAVFGDDTPDAGTAADSERAPVGRRAVFKALIERLARVQPITITRDEDWPNGAGFTLHVEFALGSGDTWKSIRDAAPNIAGGARLPKGCTISVEEGNIQGTAVVRIPTVYALDKDAWLPEDTSPLSILNDIDIALNEDTSKTLINLRQASGLIVGQRGGGKTNLLQVLIGQLLRCRDSLVWIADLNGGGLAVPFMLPYVDGEVDTSPIDWVASTPEEVVLMAEVAAAIAKDRKARYASLKARANTDLLPVTADLPQITIVIDESAEVDDDPVAREAMDALLRVQRIGRAEAVNVIFSALRATQDTIPVPVRKQSTLKLCGRVEDDSELEYAMPGCRVSKDDLIHPGTFFIRRGDVGAGVRQIKVYRTLPDKIRRVVLATAGTRPALDEPGQQVGGQAYAERMQRLAPWLARIAGKPEPAVPQPVPVATAPTRPVKAAMSKAERDAQRERAREGLRRMVRRVKIDEMPTEQLDEMFSDLVADLRPKGESGWSPDLLIEIVREAGPDGITPKEMRDVLDRRGIKVSDKTLFEHLKRFRESGEMRSDNGRYTI